MPMLPDSRSVHTNVPLTNVSVAYLQENRWIAPQVFPQVPVARQGDLYYKYDKGDWYRTVAAVRGPSTESAGGGWRVSTDSYFCDVYAVHKDVDSQIRANADSNFNLEAEATRWVTQQLALKRDQLWVDTFLATSTWTGSSTGSDLAGVTGTPTSGQFKRWDETGSTPIEDITTQRLAMIEKTGYAPNVLVLGPYVHRALLDNAQIVERMKFTDGGAVNTSLLARLFEVDRVVVATSIKATHNQNLSSETEAMDFHVGNIAWLGYSTPRPSLMEATAGYIFTWTGYLGAGAFGNQISRFYMPQIKSDRIEAEMAFDMKIVSPDLGCLFTAAIS